MAPALDLRLRQHLALTPQLQQAIRLLQLPVLELQAQIREALEIAGGSGRGDHGGKRRRIRRDLAQQSGDRLGVLVAPVPDFRGRHGSDATLGDRRGAFV